jgi:thioredoxin-like negative regulator of GroEL
MPEVDRFAALNPQVEVVKINVDVERALTTEWEVRTIPMMVYVPGDGAPRAILGFTRAEEIARKIAG